MVIYLFYLFIYLHIHIFFLRVKYYVIDLNENHFELLSGFTSGWIHAVHALTNVETLPRTAVSIIYTTCTTETTPWIVLIGY